MKFFSLNSDRAPEHLAIIIGALLMAFLNILSALKADHGDASNVKMPTMTTSVDALSGQVSARVTKWENPSLPFWKRALCRGFQRASFCSSESLAPTGPDFEDPLDPQTAAVKTDARVILYRGEINKNSALTSKLEVPEPPVLPPRIQEPGQVAK